MAESTVAPDARAHVLRPALKLEYLTVGWNMAPPQVTFDLIDFYHRQAKLVGVDSLKVSGAQSAALLRSLVPGFESGAYRPPPVEAIPLASARAAYQAVLDGRLRAKYVLVP